MATPSPNLTTSRIARLFRPLRAKCKQLVAIVENTIPKPRHSAPSIYTSRQKTKGMNQSMIYISPSGFPLTIIPPPHRLTSFGYLDSTSKHHAKLSKALYDVRDAYQHVLQACFVTTTSKQGLQSESTTSRTLSLATLCAIVLGRAVEEEVRLSRSGEKEAEDEEDVTVIGEIYDSVLPQHRPQAVSAHALSVILNSSPRHPTLLSILLAVSLQYGLTSDACVILRELLLVSSQSTIPAISTSTSLPTIPPLASSSNSEFLVSLLQECTSSSAHGAILAHINHREFTRIFVEVLSEEGHGGVEVWTCKAVRRLARKLRSEDLPAAINLCVGLSQAIGKTPPTKCSKEKKLRDRSIMEDRLSGWLESTLDALRRSESAEDFEFVVDMLLEVGSLNHLRNSVTTSLRDMVQCLTVLCLTSPSHRFRTSDQEHALSRLLRGTSPSTEAYEGLVGLILEDLPSLILETVIPTLEEWALPLRLHALLVHEASLWAGALRFLEDQFTPGAQDVPAPTIHIQTFERLRAQLVDRVEDAESRCFGATASNSESLPTKKPEEGEWRWEEMVGAWIRKSPLITRTIQRPKLQRELRALQGNRRKRSSIDDELTSPSRNKRLKPTSSFTSSISSASSSYPSSRSSRVSPSLSPSKTSWSIQDDWTPPSSPLLSDSENVTPKPHIPESWRGVSNFDSMLADAQLNRTVLHTHDISHPKPITTVQFQANDTFGGRRISWPQNLSSDDALNLFDWSSPVTTRV